MNKLQIVLSFDHELSLGRSTDYERNLFDPTKQLLTLAAELDVPLCFFTDVLCAIRFREWDDKGFFKPYQRQIAEALALGHEAQLHLHPHWVTSAYRDGTFVPSDDYTLAAFRDEPPPRDIRGIVRQGVELLNDLCRPVQPNYACIAYRGGGYSLAPAAETLRALYDCGIRIDSSIAKGMRFHSRTNQFEYNDMPRAANWFIAPDGPLNQPAADGIFEVPIAARPRTPLNNLPFLVNRVLKKGQAFSSGGRAIIEQQSSWRDRARRLFPRTVWTVSFDGHELPVEHHLKSLEYHVRRHEDADTIRCAACSHPKSMGPHQRGLMRAFVEGTRAQYGSRVEFVTFRRIHDEVFSDPSAGREARLAHGASAGREDVREA